jgi:hypothetical protein
MPGRASPWEALDPIPDRAHHERAFGPTSVNIGKIDMTVNVPGNSLL